MANKNSADTGNHLAESADERETVLVVEDDVDLATVYGEALSRTYDVNIAQTGPEAVAFLDETVDVVVLDRNLGDWTGEVLLGVIQDRRLDCAVVMVTGLRPDLDVATLPIEEYLTKPVELSTLQETVEELLVRKSCPRTEQELLSLVSRKRILEDTHDRATLEASENYRRLTSRIEMAESQLDWQPTDLESGKHRPSKCPSCGLRWDVKVGGAFGFSQLGAYVWKCADCRRVEVVPDPEKRRVARR